MSNLRRLKSMVRMRRLCPPPMRELMRWPWLFRPPVLRLPTVSAFTGRPAHSSERSTVTSWRWAGVLGLYVLSAMPLDSRRHVDLVALGQGHDRLLHVRPLADIAAEALGLAFQAQRVHGRHLDLEDPFNGRLDLRLGRIQRHTERHLIVLGTARGLLGHDGRTDQIVHADLTDGRGQLRLAHFSRASRCCTASLVRIKVSRRRMSYTLAPCCGRTSRLGMLRVARRKPSSTVGPSMISAEVQPSLPSFLARSLVLAVLILASSITIRRPSACLLDSAVFSASLRTFFGRPVSWLRTTGPKMRAPPRNCGERRLPWRALPVPFWA